jgi:hypothetical protein
MTSARRFTPEAVKKSLKSYRKRRARLVQRLMHAGEPHMRKRLQAQLESLDLYIAMLEKRLTIATAVELTRKQG